MVVAHVRQHCKNVTQDSDSSKFGRTPDATRLATTPAMPAAPATSGSVRNASGNRAIRPPSSCWKYK